MRFVAIHDQRLLSLIEDNRTGFIFAMPRKPEEPRPPSWSAHWLGNLPEGTQFEGITSHSCRRSGAITYAKLNIPPIIGAKQLGHSIRMMMEIYAQIAEEDMVEELAEASMTSGGFGA
ncbi:MAG: hypothetical protein KF836_08620 [Fimbriimonadaceae bacterium]|nr:hypothetical protein [Fimbriimonadaceae bacterium]